MPNGKPGDHPVTDIVVWKKSVFAPETDALIREIAQFTDNYAVYDPFEPIERLFWKAKADPTCEPELREALRGLLERLSRERT
jgi:hypothetical protein